MNRIFEVWSIALSDGKHHSWGAFRTRQEAEQRLTERTTGNNESWARKHHGEWWITEVDTTGLFQIPPAPSPRELYSVKTTKVDAPEGYMNTLQVKVRDTKGNVVAEYDRNYATLGRTFEPFRQGDRMFALISKHYTCTSVLDLQSGKVIASEEPDAMGFCPIGFYVPDWWDVNDDSTLPGSNYWSTDDEHPKGDFGFVWGCVWGDDSSWKIQYLDLSEIKSGKIHREERFGYVKLAPHPDLDAREFIHCEFWEGSCRVTFAVEQTYDLSSGKLIE